MKSQFSFPKNNSLLQFGMCFFLLISFSVVAKERKWEQTISGSSIVSGAIITAQDPEISNSPYFTTVKSATFVELKINDFIGPYFWYKCHMKLKITPILDDGTFDAPYHIALDVENNRYGNFGNFIDLQKHRIANSRGALVEVTGFDVDNLDTNTSLSSVPENVSLTVSYEVERYYDFSIQNTPVLVLAENVYGNNADSTNEVLISWDEISGAEEYELAWTWVDSYDESVFLTPLQPTIISLSEKEFGGSCTRIQTANLNYKIPLIYDNGYLVFRIRAIGRFWDTDHTKKQFGNWNAAPLLENAMVADWGTENIYQTTADSHPKNWQFQASYAENGKKKEVVSYFDGSLRNRQTVTKINTNEKAIVGEVIYDEEGRPAVEVLPVPSRAPILKYYGSFNRNLEEKLYSYQDFTPVGENVCNIPAVGMSPNYQGASNYYSSENEAQNNSQDFVPKANNYPFSQVEYTADNTGRIKRKGGVGLTHQLGSTHEMKYFYSVPSQEELDRLFGYNVGFVSHYKKNIVIDPNKQVSVSYIDPQGRTIATALSSENPDNMEALADEENNSLHALVKTDLLNKIQPEDKDSGLDNNERFSSGYYGELIDGLSYDAQKVFVNESTQYKFEYSLLKDTPFSYLCSPHTYKYPFIYKLYRNIVDECGEIIKPDEAEDIPFRRIGTNALDGNGNPILPGASTSFSDQFSEALPVGAYGISKKLVVDGEALDLFTDDYIRRGIIDGCILPPQAPNPNLEGCYSTCDECENHYQNLTYEAEAPGQDSYLAMMLASDPVYNALDTGSPTYEQEAELFIKRYKKEFELLIEACRKSCQDDGYAIGDGGKMTSMNCDNGLNSLLADMLPSGQYGVYPSDVDNEGDIIETDTAVTNEYISLLKMSIYNEQNEMYAAVVGIDPSNVDWRHPHFFDKDNAFPAYGETGYDNNIFKHYYKTNGEIDYVFVTWDEETQVFNPPIRLAGIPNPTPANLQPVNIIDAESGLYQIEPQDLADVQDFIRLISSRENWAMSLVKYHPEFHYLDYIYETCKITKVVSFNIEGNSNPEEITLNSDGFDALLGSKKTFQGALEAGFLAGEFTLFNSDPFFNMPHPRDATLIDITSTQDGVEVITPTVILAGQFLDLKKSMMKYALGAAVGDPNNPGKFENTGHYMAYHIYKTIRCNGLDFSCPSPAVANSFSAVINEVSTNFTEEEQDLFWVYYLSYYAALKQKIQHVFLNMHAARQGFYNDCIGNNNRENFRKIVTVIDKYPNQRNTAWSWIDGDIPAPTLFSENGVLLKDKQKRFLPYDEAYDSEASDQSNYEDLLAESNYYYLSTTGNCPILNDFGIFLDNATKASAMVSVFNASGANTPFSGGYLTPALFQAIGGNMPVTSASVSFTGTLLGGDPKILQLQCSQSFNTGISPLTLTLPGSSSYSWSSYGNTWKIVQVVQISHTATNGSVYSFTFLAKIRDIITGALTEAVIEGTTEAILTCTTSPGDVGSTDPVYVEPTEVANCTKKEDFSQALLALIENLRDTGHLNDSNYDLLGNSTYVNGYLPQYFITNPSVLYVRWQNMGPYSYSIKIGIDAPSANEQMELNMDLSQPLASLQIGQLASSNEAHVLTGIDSNENSISGEITGPTSFGAGTKNTPLKFECCVPRSDNPLTNNRPLSAFKESVKNVMNELLEHTEQMVLNHTLYFDQSGQAVPSTATGDYLLNSPTFVEFFSNYENPGSIGGYAVTITPQGKYKFEFGFEGNVVIGGGTHFIFEVASLNQRVTEVQLNEYFFLQYSNSQSDTFGISNIQNQPLKLTDGTFGTFDLGTKELKKFYYVPTCGCIPQAVRAVACHEKFIQYQNFITQFGIQNYITDPNYTDEEVFCGMNFQYIFDAYYDYIDAFSMTPQTYATHPQYITLAAFGATELNFGYAGYNTVINSFSDYIYVINTSPIYKASDGLYYYAIESIRPDLNYDLVDTWSEYAAYYVFTSNICPPKPMTPTLSIVITPDKPCIDFTVNVNATYNAEAYEEYIVALKEQFRKRYLEEAIGNVVEQYYLTYYDKEYQYTLYYYDQAGNLIQTVAPQGVERLGSGQSSGANSYRVNNSDIDDYKILPNHDFKTRYRYNSLNQLVWQSTPDGGETRFAYDALGRIVASQNNKQSLKQVYKKPPLAFEENVLVAIDGTITKGSTLPEGWNAGGSTEKLITGNGYVSRVVKDPYLLNANIMLGLSYNESGISYETINYGLYTYIDGRIHIFENGVPQNIGIVNYAVGDILKVERRNGTIYYYKNSTLLRSVVETNAGVPMLVDFSMHMNNHKIHDLEVVNFKTTNNFSYTSYDALGRIKEAGQLETNPEYTGIYINDDGRLVTAGGTLVGVDIASDYPHNISTDQIEVTRTLYDSYSPFNADDYLTPLPIRNTRNRVTGILTFPHVDPSTEMEDNETAIFYNYDIHGNVDEMVQRISPDLLPNNGMLKRVNYEYDLISGNVNKVTYQKDNSPDQFIHKYNYDADNRITDVQTSKDGFIWEKDASYEYYEHGPLSRVILGDKKVQGVDYAYTLQGWLKTVNSENLANASKDMGRDGEHVSKDSYGYSLSYFENDYQARNPGTNEAHFISQTANYGGSSLFNGNINRMITSVRGTSEEIMPTQVNLYSYDQLNRIFSMNSKTVTENSGSLLAQSSYGSSYTYDKNGNLQTLYRKAPKADGAIRDMDVLSYSYQPSTNKLISLKDHIADNEFDVDIDDDHQNGQQNYFYDELGQLVQDKAENIEKIEWRVDGKVKSVKKSDGTTINFYYDGLGNRVMKRNVNSKISTHYTRDAQGNTMGVYTLDGDNNYILKEHHIYGSSRLGIQEYIEDAITADYFNRKVGDKRYELSNHLGNVLNVVNDRKIISSETTLLYSEFFDESNSWEGIKDAMVETTGGVLKVDVPKDTQYYGGGVDLAFTAGQVISLQLTVTRDANCPPYLPLLFNVINMADDSVIVSIPVPPSGVVTQSVTIPQSGQYRISVTLGVSHPHAVTFYIDNFYAYMQPASTTDYVSLFLPDVLSYNDYYPFGMLVPNRHASTDGYRYGFQGQEKDDEIKGEGNSLNYTFRMHDPRVGRFFAVDPLSHKYPQLSSYQFSSNNPIGMKEIEGLEGVKYSEYDIDGKLIRHVVKLKVRVVTVDELSTDIKEDLFAKLGEKKGRKEWKKIKENRIKSSYIPSDVKRIKGILDVGYNGSDGKGSKNSKGELVYFSFDVQEMHIDQNNTGSLGEIISDSRWYDGIVSKDLLKKPIERNGEIMFTNKMSPQNIMVADYADGNRGDNSNVLTRIYDGKGLDATTVKHETAHQFMTQGAKAEHNLISEYDFNLSPEAIDQILIDAYKIDNPTKP